jgi:hypothetical protein
MRKLHGRWCVTPAETFPDGFEMTARCFLFTKTSRRAFKAKFKCNAGGARGNQIRPQQFPPRPSRTHPTPLPFPLNAFPKMRARVHICNRVTQFARERGEPKLRKISRHSVFRLGRLGEGKEGGGGAGEAGEKPWGLMGCLPPPPHCICISSSSERRVGSDIRKSRLVKGTGGF